MIEKKLKTIDGSITLKIPDNLNELRLGQLMEMQQKSNLSDIETISILAGVPVDDLQNIKDAHELGVFEEAILSLATQIKFLYNCDEIPKKVTFYIDEKPVAVNVMRNLAVEPAGAFLAARDIIAEEINNHIKEHGEEDWQERFNPSLRACAEVLAHYFYCRVTGERYNEYKIAETFASTILLIKK